MTTFYVCTLPLHGGELTHGRNVQEGTARKPVRVNEGGGMPNIGESTSATTSVWR